jgi:hypothetical protein
MVLEISFLLSLEFCNASSLLGTSTALDWYTRSQETMIWLRAAIRFESAPVRDSLPETKRTKPLSENIHPLFK